MIAHSRSLFERNYTYSTGGNVSHRLGAGFLITATNTSFGRLKPEEFVFCGLDGEPAAEGQDGLPAEQEGQGGLPSGRAALVPSKEAAFHAAIYRRRPDVNAVLHLHSPAAIALSCLAQPTDEGNVLPVVTSGSITRVGRLPLLEYIKPGAPRLAERIEQLCIGVNALLMQNHGMISLGADMDQAVDIAEELEQNIRVWLLTGGAARLLSDAEMAQSKPLGGAKVAAGTQRPILLPNLHWVLGGGTGR